MDDCMVSQAPAIYTSPPSMAVRLGGRQCMDAYDVSGGAAQEAKAEQLPKVDVYRLVHDCLCTLVMKQSKQKEAL